MAEGDGVVDGASGAGAPRTVFLSYASQDAEIANTVCRELEGRGIRCWIIGVGKSMMPSRAVTMRISSSRTTSVYGA
jgi:hypothetical protein